MRFTAILLLGLVALGTTACVVEEPIPPPGHPNYARWCYYHPYRCR
jgi:hypothetical protein